MLGIVIHYTKTPGATAQNEADYFFKLANQNPDDKKKDRYAGCHYVVDDKEIINTISDIKMAYHCGSNQYKPGIQKKLGHYPNAHTIGIEVCHKDDTGIFCEKTIKNLTFLVSKIMKKFNFSIKDIYTHFDIVGMKPDGTICPLYYVQNKDAWIKLLNGFNDELNK